jgi:circadian clock protein KaiC
MSSAHAQSDDADRSVAATGIEGLDRVLSGGFARNRLYLAEGSPGTGKTTLALQYLLEGARLGESVLYVALSETAEELGAVAASHGWSLAGVKIHESAPTEGTLRPEAQYTVFHPSEVELTDATATILAEVGLAKPRRLVLDSLSELRLLAGNALRYRRQILALKQFFAGSGCTVLLLDDLTATDRDLQVQSIAHGVVSLEQLQPEYGAERRRLRVLKYRGVRFRGGYHDFAIRRGGLDVFDRIVAASSHAYPLAERLSSGVAELDQLLGGGIERGTSTLIAGAAGSGKSSVAAQLVVAAAGRGSRGAMFLFDESRATLLSRCAGLGMDLAAHVASERVTLQEVDPAELSPGEFAHAVAGAAEQGAAIVVIDSLNGYLNAMPGERFLTVHLHELLSHLGALGVATVLVGVHQGLIGGPMTSPVEASYLADAIILLRYFESGGEVRQALSIIKKRGGTHERTIREFRLESGAGIRVGPPLREFHGVLTGVPVYSGAASDLMSKRTP